MGLLEVLPREFLGEFTKELLPRCSPKQTDSSHEVPLKRTFLLARQDYYTHSERIITSFEGKGHTAKIEGEAKSKEQKESKN